MFKGFTLLNWSSAGVMKGTFCDFLTPMHATRVERTPCQNRYTNTAFRSQCLCSDSVTIKSLKKERGKITAEIGNVYSEILKQPEKKKITFKKMIAYL